MTEIVEFFIKEHGRHPFNDPIGRKYKYNPQELMEFAERYAQHKQRREAGQHESLIMWRLLEDEKPAEKGWYLVATDNEWRRDFWDGEGWDGQGKSKYTKYWAKVQPPQAT